ncbi:hypothetical protein AB3X91_30645 [Paraburkholderia sp. BR14263]|uniref:hypothetical protein n=1 Tax=unclassified Paraburkholderia TaxID=2615204 RepID=UPI0034CFA63E
MPNTAGIKVLRVSAKANGYRREGLRFDIGAADVPVSILTSGQIHRLKRDPLLDCKEVTVFDQPTVSDAELAQLREKAAIADALRGMLPTDFPVDACPTQYVKLLEDQVLELTDRNAALTQQAGQAQAEKAPSAHQSAEARRAGRR